jgi:hypothetical protein
MLGLSANAFSLFSLVPAANTNQPRPASLRTHASPSPPVAPVKNMTFILRTFLIFSLLHHWSYS